MSAVTPVPREGARTAPAATATASEACVTPGAGAALGAWTARHRVPLAAALLSRLLVVGGGLLGALVLRPHRGTAAFRDGHGLGGLLTTMVDHWDSAWYLRIAEHGYTGHAASAGGLQRLAFMPAYPLAIRLLSVALRSPVAAGAAISVASFAAALLLLHRLCELEFGGRAADVTVVLLAFSPLSLFFSAVYTESLFLLLTVGSLLALRTGRWRLACVLGAASALTRVTGIAITCALLVGRCWRERRLERGLAWAALVPGALAVYALVLAVMGLPPLGILTAEQSGWSHEFVGPLLGTLVGVLAGAHGAVQLAQGTPVYAFADREFISAVAENVLLALVLIGLIWTAVAGRRRLAPPQLALLVATLVICTSSPIRSFPMWSLDRYALTIVPAWMVVGDRLARRPRLTAGIVGLSCLGLLYCSAEFAIGSWVA